MPQNARLSKAAALRVGTRPMHVLIISASVVIAGVWTAANAQEKPAAKPAAAASAQAKGEAAEKAYASGVKAFDGGKVDSAVVSLSSALRQGGLPAPKMAKALFYRGAAYRKQGKPAQAISDLTSAVWIKGGLSDGDRLAAIEQRKAAYKEAGLGTSVPSGLTPGAGVPSTATATAVPVAAPKVSSTATGAATSGWQTTAAAQQAAPVAVAPQPAATTQAPAPSSSSPFSALTPPITPAPPPPTTLSALPQGSTGAQSPSTPTGSAAPSAIGTTFSNVGNSISQGLSGVGSFFGNMFTPSGAPPASSTATAATPTSGIATSSTAPAPTAVGTAKAPSVTQGWGPATKAAPQPSSASPKKVRTAAVAPAKPAPKPAAKIGKFKLQVAAVRSEAKAQQVVAQLKTKYASQLGSAAAEIDAASIGNMGTFYRVRVGPYADTKAPRGLCASLKTDGFDCLIVTQ
ncbi:MAG: SPOR domain-containing protein [Alphaproteobacteria bacterium]|nr:SPOR domain-containing protein [Alphaproteobacteria bacterium]